MTRDQLPKAWKTALAWLMAGAVFVAGAWLRMRHLGAHDLGNDEIGLAFASPLNALRLESLAFTAPLPALLTGLALGAWRDVIGLRLLSLVASLGGTLALFWIAQRRLGGWAALPFVALLAFDPTQVWLALFGGAYALIVLLQIVLLDQTWRIEQEPETASHRGWLIASLLLVYTHYLAWPLVALSALSLAVSAWRRSDEAHQRCWRALAWLSGLSAPLVGALVVGLVLHRDRALTGGIDGGGSPGALGFLSGPSAPFGGWTPGASLGALVGIVALGVILRGGAGRAALRHGAYLALLVLGLSVLTRMAPFQAALLQIPCLAVFMAGASQVQRLGPGARMTGRLLAVLAFVGAPVAASIPPVHSLDAAHVLSSRPYAPLTELAYELRGRQGAVVMVFPPHHALALAIHRRGSFDLDPCDDDVDARGVIRAVSCPEGSIRGAWMRADRRVPDYRALPPDRPVVVAIERARVWSLDFERPESPIDWDARQISPTRLDLPARCQPLVVPDWIAWACPPVPGS
jgi:hypothetical protein